MMAVSMTLFIVSGINMSIYITIQYSENTKNRSLNFCRFNKIPTKIGIGISTEKTKIITFVILVHFYHKLMDYKTQTTGN